MTSLEALIERVEAMELAMQVKDARIAKLEAAVGSLVGEVWTCDNVRAAFIEFFTEEQGHKFWKSSPCVPHNDPTILFANAGMNQFKPLFLGQCEPGTPMAGLKRACNSQKCIRAGGKHNDLDDVGKDVYHHTFFEMLGNWSFGDYFKEEAISMAWMCLTVKFKLDPDRLYVTYFGGDEDKAPGVPSDEETKAIWLKLGLPEARVLPFDAADNFWEMGETGPCGPCTEIHYDRIGGRDAASLVNMDDPDVLEIWNNVFIQYTRDPAGLTLLPSQHVDTGMGFERLTSILQNKNSNYDTDIFKPLFAAIQEETGAPPYTGFIGEKDVDTKDMAYRVVADHIRTLTFSIADGARPDKDGRGYVLRRILRRAVYFGSQFLGAKKGFFHKLVPAVVKKFGGFFEELKAQEQTVMSVLTDEETQFNRTIEQGLRHFSKVTKELKAKGSTVVSGKEAFFLAGTLGFPFDLTEIMAEQQGLTVNKVEFEEVLKASKAGSKAISGNAKDMTMESTETCYLNESGIEATTQDAKFKTAHEPRSTVTAIFTGRGQQPKEAGFTESVDANDEMIGIIMESSPFYAEAGGQIYDTGILTSTDGSKEIRVVEVHVYAGYVLHMGTVESGRVSVGDELTCFVDYRRREKIAPNHTLTHVLNFALRKVLLGIDDTTNKLQQKGSHVDDQRLRFDVSWDTPITPKDLQAVEEEVNRQISENYKVDAYVAPQAQALQIAGLRAVFGENYPDPVRIISIGADVKTILEKPEDQCWRDFSIEFCGGTHIEQLGDAESFVIIEESNVAKGVRRIVGVTRERAHQARANAELFTTRVAEAEKIEAPLDLDTELRILKKEMDTAFIGCVARSSIYDRLNDMAKTLKEWKKTQTKQREARCVSEVEEFAKKTPANSKVVLRLDFGSDGKTGSKVMKAFCKANKTSSLLIISTDPDKQSIMVVSFVLKAHITESFDALLWCTKTVDAAGGGKCGGKGSNANGSVQGLGGLSTAVEAAEAAV